MEDYNQTYVDYYQTRASNGRYERMRDNYVLMTDALLTIVILSITMIVYD